MKTRFVSGEISFTFGKLIGREYFKQMWSCLESEMSVIHMEMLPDGCLRSKMGNRKNSFLVLNDIKRSKLKRLAV